MTVVACESSVPYKLCDFGCCNTFFERRVDIDWYPCISQYLINQWLNLFP